MKYFTTSHFITVENPHPRELHRVEFLTSEEKFKNLGGLFAVLPPGCEVPYHFHKDRESVIVALSGEAIEIIDGKEMIFKQGDVICIPAGEKHGTANRSEKEFRYMEFFTCPRTSRLRSSKAIAAEQKFISDRKGQRAI